MPPGVLAGQLLNSELQQIIGVADRVRLAAFSMIVQHITAMQWNMELLGVTPMAMTIYLFLSNDTCQACLASPNT